MGSDKSSRGGSDPGSERPSAPRTGERGPGPTGRRAPVARPPAKARPAERRKLLPEDYLVHAMQAKSAAARANWAQRGLAHEGRLDRTTRAMLLRQLYLAFFASGHFERAHSIAAQAVGLGVLEDVVHQDCARALQAAGDIDGAVRHLRIATRIAPASRRAFHWWTLGSLLFVANRPADAIPALERACRWATREKPLYQGHLALAKHAAGVKVRGLERILERLAACPAGQGYGRFVLGHLAFHASRYDEARRYLSTFVERTARGHLAIAHALHGEVAFAEATLASLRKAS